jgi:HK97 family phage prohead protease
MTDTWTSRALAHEPLGKPGGPGLFHHKNMQLPAYIQHIAKDLMESRGMPESEAIATAVAQCKRWAAGGQDVKPETRAKAAAAVAEWERLKGQTHANRSTPMSDDHDASGQARKGTVRRSAGELMRIYPLEDIHILTRAEGDGTGRVVEAYATVFDQPAEIHDHQGHYTEVIDRAAFDQVLARIMRSSGGLAAQVKVLYNHGKTIGGAEAPEFQLPLGKPLDIRPEPRGLLTRTEYDASDPFTERILSKIHAGTITAQSFVGGIVRSSPELKGPGDRYRGRNGALTTVRRMILGLREYGPVLFPAYTGAEILGVRMQLPGAVLDEGAADYDQDEESAPAMEEDGAGGTPEEVHPSRLNAHRLWQLRNEELCRQAGIALPGREQ